MCGRYATVRDAQALSRVFEAADETDGALAPDYNVAPTDPVPIVRLTARPGTGPDGSDLGPGDSGTAAARVLSVARWGLVPHWARDARAGTRMINARAETVAGSSAFARYFTGGRRCLVPAEGWYEWKGRGRPYFLTGRGDEPLAFAGLWAASPVVPGRLTCTILTTAAVGPLAEVHDRMPLLLPRDRWGRWLAAPATPALLAPPPPEFVAALEVRPVGPAVGDVRTDGPQLIAPATHPAPDAPPATLF
ncbi:MAG TPA: SOS response-associated peptidase [Pilimelia sp.]|nr:SOS response-associated peptidase [Pilimelia sp.]